MTDSSFKSMRCPACAGPLSDNQSANDRFFRCDKHGLWISFNNINARDVGCTSSPSDADAQTVPVLGELLSRILVSFASPGQLSLRTGRGWTCVTCGKAMSGCFRGAFDADLCVTHGVWVPNDQYVSFCQRALGALNSAGDDVVTRAGLKGDAAKAALVSAVVARLS